MTSIRKGDVKRLRVVADFAAGQLPRLFNNMALGSDLAAKGKVLPEKTSIEWAKEPRELRVTVETPKGAHHVHRWPREAIDALPDRVRAALRIITYDDVPIGDRKDLQPDWQSIYFDQSIPEGVVGILERGMRSWNGDIKYLIKAMKLGEFELADLVYLAELLPVPSLTDAGQLATDLLRSEDSEREARRVDKAGGSGVAGVLPRGDTDEHSDAAFSAQLGGPRATEQNLSTKILQKELATESSDVNAEKDEEAGLLKCDTSTGIEKIIRLLIGSKTPLGNAKALLVELGCEYIKSWGAVEFDEFLKQLGWDIPAAGERGATIPTGEEAAAYPKIIAIFEKAAAGNQQVIQVIRANGKKYLMSALINTKDIPSFVLCFTDLRIGGPSFDPERPTETSNVVYEAKTTAVIKDDEKVKDTKGQMIDQYVAELRTAKAPPLVAGGDHHLRTLAACASLQPHPSKPGEDALCFHFFELDPRKLAGLVLHWTRLTDDFITNRNRNAFPTRLVSAWLRLKHEVSESKCETLEEAEVVAATLKELRQRRSSTGATNEEEGLVLAALQD